MDKRQVLILSDEVAFKKASQKNLTKVNSAIILFLLLFTLYTIAVKFL